MANDIEDDIGLGDDDEFEGLLDDELDGMDLGIDGFSEPPPPKNAREAVERGLKDAGTSFVESFTDDAGEAAKDTLKHAIPKSLGTETSQLSDMHETAKDEISKAAEEVKKTAKETFKVVKDILPKGNEKIDSVMDKIAGWVGADEDNSESKESKEQALLNEINQSISSAIGEKQDASAIQEMINNQIQQNANKTQQQLLNANNAELTRVRTFLNQVAGSYYRKSLELQFRQMYLQKESVDVLKTGFDTFKNQFEAIIKNTSLPDIIKTKTMEGFTHSLKQKAFGSISDNLINNNPLVETFKKNFTEKIQDVKEKLISGLEETNSGLAMLAGDTPGMSLTNLLGIMAAETVKEKVGNKAGELFSKTKVGKQTISGVKNFMGDFSNNISSKLGEYGTVGSAVGDFMADMTNTRKKNNFVIEKESHNEAHLFDNRVHSAIVKVIPNLLSKIYSEVKTIRNKGLDSREIAKLDKRVKDHELIYNYDKDTFETKSEMVRNIKTDFTKRMEKSVGVGTENILKLLGDDRIGELNLTLLGPDGKREIRRAIVKYLTNPRANKSPDKFFKGVGRHITQPLFKKLWLDSGKKLLKYASTKDPSVLDSVISNINSIISGLPNTSKYARELHAVGRQDISEELGFTKYDELTGNIVSDKDSYMKNAIDAVNSINEKRLSETVKLDSIEDKYKKLASELSSKTKGDRYIKLSSDDKKLLRKYKKQLLDRGLDWESEFPKYGLLTKGFATGGYTGDGDKYEDAGKVHKSEYVINKKMLEELIASVKNMNSKDITDKISKIVKDVKDATNDSKIKKESIKAYENIKKSKIGQNVSETFDKVVKKFDKVVTKYKANIDIDFKLKEKTTEYFNKLKNIELKDIRNKGKDVYDKSLSIANKAKNKVIIKTLNSDEKRLLKNYYKANLKTYKKLYKNYNEFLYDKGVEVILKYRENIGLKQASINTFKDVKNKVTSGLETANDYSHTQYDKSKDKFTTIKDEVYSKGKDVYDKANKFVNEKYIKLKDLINKDPEAESTLRAEFFKSKEYIEGRIDNFYDWLEKVKNIDTEQTKNKIFEHIDDLKKKFSLDPWKKKYNKFMEEAKEELIGKITGTGLKELTLDEESKMRELFFESKEYKEGLVTNFDDWLKAYGYRRNGTGIFGRIKAKLSIKNLLKQTRKLDKKIFKLGVKGVGNVVKTGLKMPLYLTQGANAGIGFAGKRLSKSKNALVSGIGSGVDYISGGVSKGLNKADEITGGTGRFTKLALKAGALAGGVQLGVPGMIAGYYGTKFAAKGPLGVVNDATLDAKMRTKVGMTNVGNKIKSLFTSKGDKDPKINDNDTPEVISAKKDLMVINTIKALKDRILPKKVKGDKDGDGIRDGSWKEKLSKEATKDDKKTSVKDKIKNIGKTILNKGSKFLTPTTMILGAIGILKTMGLSMEDVKEGITKVKDTLIGVWDFIKPVLNGVWTGIKGIWKGGEILVDFIKKSYYYIKNLPANLSISLRKALSHIPGLGSLAPSEEEIRQQELRNQGIEVDSKGNPITETESNDSNMTGNIIGAGLTAYAGKKVYNVGRSVYNAGKATYNAGKKVKNFVTGKKEPPKPKPKLKKASIIKKIKSLLSTMKSKIIKKVGKKAGAKLLAKLSARFIPFVGTAMLAYDAVKIGYDVIHNGTSLKSAISKQILGFDVFDDNEPIKDDNGNPIKPKVDVDKLAKKYEDTKQSMVDTRTGIKSIGFYGAVASKITNKDNVNLDEIKNDMKNTKPPKPISKQDILNEIKVNAGFDKGQLLADLVRDEGLRTHKYKDSLGYDTIGVGHLVEKGKGIPLHKIIGRDTDVITKDEAYKTLAYDVNRTAKDLYKRLPWLEQKPEPVQRDLLNMAFNMGTGGLLGFKNTLKKIENGDYGEAAKGLVHSKWFKQVGNRAKRIVNDFLNIGNEDNTVNINKTDKTVSVNKTEKPIEPKKPNKPNIDKHIPTVTKETTTVTDKPSTDYTPHLDGVAKGIHKSVSIQSQMLEVLGEIKDLLHHNVNSDNKPKKETIKKQEPVINLARQTFE